MNAILSKGDGLYLLAIVTTEGKGLICLRFNDWLTARVTLDNFGYEDCLSIEKVKDVSGGAVDNGYSESKGIDYDFTF